MLDEGAPNALAIEMVVNPSITVRALPEFR
jgi:hypothetical protein